MPRLGACRLVADTEQLQGLQTRHWNLILKFKGVKKYGTRRKPHGYIISFLRTDI